MEILSEIFQSGCNSKKVRLNYNNILTKFGPELEVLNFIAINDLRKSDITLLPEAILRMRNNEVKITPGFDGQYGSVRIFTD